MAIFIDFLCGIALPVFLLIAGIFFLVKLRFFYILHPVKSIKETVFSGKGAFKSLCIALGGTLGIGNIIGVGSAIAMGGYGAVFWMIVSAFLAMSVKYAEVYLAMKSKRKGKNGFFGGASYYIYDGFKNLAGENFAFFLGSIFALFCVINSFTTGNLVQINAVSNLLPINKIILGLIFALLSFIIVSKGVKSIGFANSVIIPTLTLFYFVLCITILIFNREKIPLALSEIIKGAFSPSCVFFGVSGYGISTAIRYGFTRGLLSNEAGCGTSPSAHASSNASAHQQSCLGIFEVFVDTVVLCTLTALVIIVSGIMPSSDSTKFVLDAFYSLSGNLGKFSVLASCMLFALATICTQYFYGIESLSFITHKRAMKTAFKILFFLIIIFGTLLPIKIMWQISDIALSVMTILNLSCILILNKKVAK